MPYIRKGKCVYRKNPDGSLTKKGCSKSVKEAEAYMRKLYQVSEDEEQTFQEAYDMYMEKYTKKKKKVSPLRAKCQAKAKAKYTVWPSAYASGYVQKCVKRKGKIK